MKQTEFKEFCDLMDLIAEQYSKTISEGSKVLYFQGLIGYDFEAVKQGLYRHIRNPDNGMFMPKIADIIKMLQGSTQDAAMVAWTKVDKAVRQVGTQVSVVFDDPIIHRVLQDMGGWLALGTKQETEWPFVAKEFENRYRGFASRNEKPDYLKLLTGLYDAQNAFNGFKPAPPVLIGNKEEAEKVLIGGNNEPKEFKQLGQ